MTPQKECVTCRFLGKCQQVDSLKLWNHWFCSNWETSSHEEVQGRVRAINDYGEAAVTALVTVKEG